jgi:hypothetical protein
MTPAAFLEASVATGSSWALSGCDPDEGEADAGGEVGIWLES